MVIRALPPDEWHRLDGTELGGEVRCLLSHDVAKVLVVEDEGEIVGCWAVLTVRHLEGFWVAPSRRRDASVKRALLGTMQQWLAKEQVEAVITGASNETVGRYLERLGAAPLPWKSYVWRTEDVCRQR